MLGATYWLSSRTRISIEPALAGRGRAEGEFALAIRPARSGGGGSH